MQTIRQILMRSKAVSLRTISSKTMRRKSMRQISIKEKKLFLIMKKKSFSNAEKRSYLIVKIKIHISSVASR